jgi:hypothetical protein
VEEVPALVAPQLLLKAAARMKWMTMRKLGSLLLGLKLCWLVPLALAFGACDRAVPMHLRVQLRPQIRHQHLRHWLQVRIFSLAIRLQDLLDRDFSIVSVSAA